MGLPVIATRYGGNTDFMNENNSLLVDYILVPACCEGALQYQEVKSWAEPDVACAAAHMRTLLESPERGRRLGAAAAEYVRKRFDSNRLVPEYAAFLHDLLQRSHTHLR